VTAPAIIAEIDKDLIRVQVAGLLERVGEPQAFDAGLHDLLRSLGSEEQAAGARRFIPGMSESYGCPFPLCGSSPLSWPSGVSGIRLRLSP